MKMEIYPWQHKEWQTLLSSVEQGRLAHAHLLYGSPGLGKMQFAGALAARLLCEVAKGNAFACGACRSCQLLTLGHHPDLFVVTTEEKSKSIKVDQIRHLIQKLANTSQRGGRQIVMLYPAEQMNPAAANALLKTLEEPIGNVVLMLVAHQMGKLPATIVSRCQRIHFAAKEDVETIHWVRRHIEQGLDARLFLRMADCAPVRAVLLARTGYLVLRDNVLRHLLNILQENANPITPVLSYTKEDLELLLYALLTLMMDVSRLQLGAETQYVINSDRVEPLQVLGKILRATFLQRHIEKIQKAYQLFVGGTSINVQLLLESLFLDWSEVS